ncbi:MAG: SMP-30/gluconolactonase/LRE family protein [bacterium]
MSMKYWGPSLGVLALLLLYLLFWPIDIEPVAWTPPANPGFVGKYQSNKLLKHAEKLDVPSKGPEDVVFDQKGSPITGLHDGRIIRLSPQGDTYRTIANTGGRPLGLEGTPDGSLYVADARKGVLKLTQDGKLTQLTNSANGERFGFTNNLAVDSEGTVYFTDSSRRFGYGEVKPAVIAHRADGRLLKYNPDTEETDVLLRNLVFPNGVTLGRDNSTLYLNEMGTFRIIEVNTNSTPPDTSVLVDELPGFPDNINLGPDNRLWAGLANPRNSLLDTLGPYPFLRKVILRLPSILKPKPVRHGIVLSFSLNGSLLLNLQDSSGRTAYTASAVPYQEKLYIGSYREPHLMRYDLSQISQ